MALNKLRRLGKTSFGVTIPKDGLQIEELLDESDCLRDDYYVHIRHIGEKNGGSNCYKIGYR